MITLSECRTITSGCVRSSTSSDPRQPFSNSILDHYWWPWYTRPSPGTAVVWIWSDNFERMWGRRQWPTSVYNVASTRCLYSPHLQSDIITRVWWIKAVQKRYLRHLPSANFEAENSWRYSWWVVCMQDLQCSSTKSADSYVRHYVNRQFFLQTVADVHSWVIS